MSTRTLPQALSDDQVRGYHDQGYLVLRRVFAGDEVAALASEAATLLGRDDLIDTANIRCRWADHVETGECLFDCFDPVIDIGPVCRRVSRDSRILVPLEQLYGEPAHLLKDKLIFKRPGVKGYGLHQDYIAWKEFPPSFVTVIVAIDPTDAANGATEIFTGYHRQGCLSTADGDYHELPPETVEAGRGVVLELEPGDLAIFSGFTPHCSAPNTSGRWRRQLYLSYNAQRDGGPQRDAHYRVFHDWLTRKYAEYGRTNVYFR
jgi:ectoine hydroxylase-related dioxygenase (phytanoyl-CoA dioxygenase family)